MRLTRVFVAAPLAPDRDLDLPAGAASHVARVLRLRAGAPIVVFDGSGEDFGAEIVAVAGERVRVRVGTAVPGVPESPLAITLVQAVSRGEKMDWTLQKATELGVRTIVPVLSARSVVRLDERQAENKWRHWQAVIAAACEQCGRSRLPELQQPQPLPGYLAGTPPAGRRFVLSPLGAAPLAGLAGAAAWVELLIGPEGGLDDAEIALAERSGYESVRLGPRVLRTETAGIVALAVLQARWGDLQ